jgi:hypothetical protein
MSTISVFVFIDALGWEVVQRRGGFLRERFGTSKRLESIFGYSSTCDPTILTGLMPRDHGHFSFFAYDPPNSPFHGVSWMNLIPKQLRERGRVRRLISRLYQKKLGYTGYFQLYNMPFEKLAMFDYTEKRDLYEPGGIISGAKTIFDVLRGRSIPYYVSNWRRGEVENLAALKEAVVSQRPRMVYLYWAEMDALLHAKGTQHPDVETKIQWYEARLAELLDELGKTYEEVRMFVFSDHGMTDVRECLALIPLVEKLGLRFGVDYAACYDSTMARFWFLNAEAEKRIRGLLAEIPQGRMLTEEDHRKFGTDFPTNRYGDLFFLLNPGVLLCPSFLGVVPLKGMHGYTPEDKDTDAAFLSTVAEGDFLAPVPKRLDDLFALMQAEALGR